MQVQVFIGKAGDGMTSKLQAAEIAGRAGIALAIKEWDSDRTALRTVLEHNARVAPDYSWIDIDHRVRAAYQRAIALAQ